MIVLLINITKKKPVPGKYIYRRTQNGRGARWRPGGVGGGGGGGSGKFQSKW